MSGGGEDALRLQFGAAANAVGAQWAALEGERGGRPHVLAFEAKGATGERILDPGGR